MVNVAAPKSSSNASTELNTFSAQGEYNEVTFTKVKLEAARLVGKEFYDCRFSHCSLRESVVRDCKFNDCTFQDCDLSLARFEGCSFADTSFVRCKVTGVDWTLAAWSKFQAESPIHFTECVVDFSAFIGLRLKKISFQKCSAKEVAFADADLTSANFSGTDLTKSRFQQTNLTKANFEGATNYSIDVATNKLTKARFALPEALSLLYGLDIVLVE
jgi:fluoroquinolone resistance protein